MKSSIILLLLLSLIIQVNGQQRIIQSSLQRGKTVLKSDSRSSGSEALSRFGHYSKKKANENHSSKAFTDTLNYPLSGQYSIYFTDAGYVAGNNEYGDLAKANYFDNSMDLYITGILMEFAWATGSGTDIEIAIWDNTGTANSPGTKLTYQMIPLNDIVDDVANEAMTYIPLDIPLEITSSFYVGVILPQSAGDTLALWTNTDGDTDPATAWELWNTNEWYAYDNPDSWDLKISHAIFPIVTDEVTLTAQFSANSTQVVMGSDVQFTDLSVGGPVSWMWEFEGGTPATSTDQNPLVTYEQPGTFDVKLKISDGTNSDSITKQNYVVVTEQPQTIDTLLYPLPGSYVVFTVTSGGYVCGNNSYGDLAKANFFNNVGEGNITGMLIDFVWAVGGNPSIEVAVWDNDGSNAPGNKIGSAMIPLSTIKSDVSAQQPTFVQFNNPVPVSGSFFAGFYLPTAAGDTLVVWSNDDGDTSPGIAWEMWDDNSWYPFNMQPSWGINCALAIFPIIDFSMDVPELKQGKLLNVYPNPSAGKYYIALEENEIPESLEIFDTKGRIIKTQSDFNARNEIAVDLTMQQNGIYFIRLITEKGNYWSKVIKR